MTTQSHGPRAFILARFERLFGPEREERGVIAIIAALLMTVMLFATALSVDIAGRVAELRRDQAAADLAALDAIQGPGAASYQSVACANANQNKIWSCTGPTAFVTATAVTVNGTPGVKVIVTTPYNDFFGRSSSEMSRSAVAENTGMAQFLIGTTLVELTAELGPVGAADLNLVGYNGLASGNVTLGALAAQLGFSALSADQVLGSTASVEQLVTASSNLVTPGDPTESASLSALGTALESQDTDKAQLSLGTILGLQKGSGVGLGATINMLQVVTAAAQLANQKAGLSVNLTAGLPANVTAASLSVTALSPPTLSPYGPVGITATNTQVSVNAMMNLNVTLADLAVVQLALPLTLTLGGATGTLQAIDCSGGVPVDIQLGTALQPVTALVGPGTGTVSSLLGVTLANVSGSVALTGTPVSGTVVTEANNFVTSSNPTPVTVNSPLSTATSNLNLQILVATLGLTNAVIDNAVNVALPGTLQALATSLDGASFGVNVDSVDYLGVKAACQAPRLVG